MYLEGELKISVVKVSVVWFIKAATVACAPVIVFLTMSPTITSLVVNVASELFNWLSFLIATVSPPEGNNGVPTVTWSLLVTPFIIPVVPSVTL